MTRYGWFLAAAVTVLFAAHLVAVAVIVAVAGLGLYFWSLGPVPVTKCPKCAGSDTHRPWLWGLLFPHAFQLGCRSKWCNGGVKVRLGVRVFNPAKARELSNR